MVDDPSIEPPDYPAEFKVNWFGPLIGTDLAFASSSLWRRLPAPTGGLSMTWLPTNGFIGGASPLHDLQHHDTSFTPGCN